MWVLVFPVQRVWDRQISSVSQVTEDVCMAPDRDGGRDTLYLLSVWVERGGK